MSFHAEVLAGKGRKGFSLPICNTQSHFSPFPVYVDQNVMLGRVMLKSDKTTLDQ